MGFAENLKKLRKEKYLSQEELAEVLDVSRQAVSKWEQGIGYPEAEKLLLISNKFNVSLDSLMSTEIVQESNNKNNGVKRTIVITSMHENVVVSCYKVLSTGKMNGGKLSPKYALFAVSDGTSSFWGEPTTFLGWYESKEKIENEIAEIKNAIINGIEVYTLKYNAKTERRWTGLKIIE